MLASFVIMMEEQNLKSCAENRFGGL